ncbi:hypothetical protein L218DRAFT_618259 [Marasmius fiardii PR-910]|nr:hypothetical protein L218DRAFT_618259 [Marasmius fiardii PR-910]
MHNSETRHPLPRCFPGTRQEVLKPLLRELEAAGSHLYWLSAPLGVGKTTVAQTICEECTEKGICVASFFFSKHPKRNVPSYLFLSIAYQLFSSLPELRGPISNTIRYKPDILEGTLDWQFDELIIKPCRELWATKGDRVFLPRVVVVIDALECIGRVDAQRVLTIIGDALAVSPWLPLQFLICSRPEPYIKDIFDSALIGLRVSRYTLRDDLSRRDIAGYLRQECRRIRRDDRFKNILFPTPWPTKNDVKTIAKSGQFSYASSLVQYLEEEYSLPYIKLDIALGRIPPPRPENTFPFAPLDVLYRDVLSTHHERSHLLNVLAVVILKTFKSYSVAEVEVMMNLEPGEIRLALSGMHSVLSIPKHPNLQISDIKVYHDSFTDFLFDKSRSEDFYIDQSTFTIKFDGLIAGSIR